MSIGGGGAETGGCELSFSTEFRASTICAIRLMHVLVGVVLCYGCNCVNVIKETKHYGSPFVLGGAITIVVVGAVTYSRVSCVMIVATFE